MSKEGPTENTIIPETTKTKTRKILLFIKTYLWVKELTGKYFSKKILDNLNPI